MDVPTNPLRELGERLGAHGLGHLLAVHKQDQGRDRTDVEADGEIAVRVNIDLGDDNLHVLFKLLKDRHHGAAGTAPDGPEVDEHDGVVRDRLIEVG